MPAPNNGVPGASGASENMLKHKSVEFLHSFKRGVVRNEGGGARLNGGCGLQRVRCPETMNSAKACRRVGDPQTRGNPIQLGIGGPTGRRIVKR